MTKSAHSTDVDMPDPGRHTITVGPREGLLLVRSDPDGGIHAEVLALGLMTEGRLESSIMVLYNALVRARATAANAILKQQDEERRHAVAD